MFQSCSSGDDSAGNNDGSIPNSQDIIGKWAYFQVGHFPPGTTITGNESLSDGQPPVCSTKKDYIEFWSEGTLKKVEYKKDCYEEVSYGTWAKTDFLLNVNYGTELEQSLEIITLTNTTLKLKFYSYSNEGTPEETLEEIIVLSFKKI